MQKENFQAQFPGIQTFKAHQVKKCPYCGALNPIEATHCMSCGMAFPPELNVKPIKCPNCGSLNPPDAIKCSVCGYPLNSNVQMQNVQQNVNFQDNFNSPGNNQTSNMQNPSICPNCGYSNPPGATYCLKCGYRLK